MQVEQLEQVGKPMRQYDEKLEACYDVMLRKCVYASAAGVFAGLLFFRSPSARWATMAFGAGVGIGSGYTDCSRILRGTDHWIDSTHAK